MGEGMFNRLLRALSVVVLLASLVFYAGRAVGMQPRPPGRRKSTGRTW